MLYYVGTLTGTAKGGSGKAGQVRVQQGQRALAKMTGMNPIEFASEMTQVPALAKQIMETVQRAGAIQRLSNSVELQGKTLEQVAKSIQDTNAHLLNRPLREIKRKLAGSPELKRLQIALNEMQREYAYLTAGGAQSKAMLPVGVSGHMEKIFSEDSTLPEITAEVDQVRQGAANETAGNKKTIEDLKAQLRGGRVGSAISGGTASPAANRALPGPVVAPSTAEQYLQQLGR